MLSKPRSILSACVIASSLAAASAGVQAQSAAPLHGAPAADAQTGRPAINPEVIRVLVSAAGETTLVAPMTGRIKTLSVNLGSGFRKGQALIVFDCSENAAKLKIADAELTAARENFDAKTRLRGLQAAGDTEVNLAAAAVDKAVGQVELAHVELDQCVVAAPFGGRIAKLYVKQYQGVTVGTPLADLISAGPLKVRLNVPSRWLKTLRSGTPFTVQVDETGRSYAARVTAISARVDADAQTVAIEGNFSASYPELLAGMSGSAHFDGLK